MTFTLPEPFVELPPLDFTDQDVRASLEAIQQNLGALAGQIASLDAAGGVLRVIGAGGRKADRGTNTVTFTAANFSANKTIAHGLSVAPVVVLAIDQTAGNALYYRTNNYTATTFDVLGSSPFGPLTATVPFGWLAVS